MAGNATPPLIVLPLLVGEGGAKRRVRVNRVAENLHTQDGRPLLFQTAAQADCGNMGITQGGEVGSTLGQFWIC